VDSSYINKLDKQEFIICSINSNPRLIRLQYFQLITLGSIETITLCPVTDPAFRSCYNNIRLLKFYECSVGHKNKYFNIKACFFFFHYQKKVSNYANDNRPPNQMEPVTLR